MKTFKSWYAQKILKDWYQLVQNQQNILPVWYAPAGMTNGLIVSYPIKTEEELKVD